MTIEIYTELKNEIESRLLVVENIVTSFSKGQFGLVAMTVEFREANANFNRVFNELKVLNKHTSNKIKRDYAMNKRFNN